MPLTLLLLRHAEAQAAADGVQDVERALTARGRIEALDAAACIRAARLQVGALLVSPARRARETAVIVAAELQISDSIRIEPALYPGEPETVLTALRHCDDTAHTLLLVGHNPGLSALAGRCQHARERLELQPAGLCRIRFGGGSWNQARPECAVALAVLR